MSQYRRLTFLHNLLSFLLLGASKGLGIHCHVDRQQCRDNEIRSVESKENILLLGSIHIVSKEISNDSPHSCGNMRTVQNGRDANPILLEQQTIGGNKEEGKLEDELGPNK